MIATSPFEAAISAQAVKNGCARSAPDTVLKMISTGAGAVNLQFLAVSNRTYSVLYKDDLNAPNWSRLIDVPAQSANHIEIFSDPSVGFEQRFYRLVTPQWP